MSAKYLGLILGMLKGEEERKKRREDRMLTLDPYPVPSMKFRSAILAFLKLNLWKENRGKWLSMTNYFALTLWELCHFTVSICTK